VGPGRLEALIDGVFAIAVTLLVLDLPRPQSSTALGHDLSQQWPAYVAYLVSFVTIGPIWIEHHGMMSAVRTIDRRLLERTLAFLLFVSVIPWPTAIAAQYADQGFSQARTAAILYASTMLLMGLTFAWGWQYLAAHPEMVAAPAPSPWVCVEPFSAARSISWPSSSRSSAQRCPSRSMHSWLFTSPYREAKSQVSSIVLRSQRAPIHSVEKSHGPSSGHRWLCAPVAGAIGDEDRRPREELAAEW